MLDQHINRRSLTKHRSSVPPSSIPWLHTKLPAPSKSLPIDNSDATSPTPKRRNQDNVKENAQKRLKSTRSSACDLDFTREDNSYGSPTTKSVAFSDKIESSPTQRDLRSSPIPSSASKPSKSILRNNNEIRKTVSDLSWDRSPFKISPSKNGSAIVGLPEIDPRTIEYWRSGEIHGLLDANNTGEFRRLITGGLELLEQSAGQFETRSFEIYATFNNILISSTAKSGHDVSEQNFKVISELLGKITSICIPQLISEQRKLLSKKSKKDPFVSRIYVQVVRFFGFILSNFKIIKYLNKKPQLQQKLKEFYDISKDALSHRNSNKVILAAHISVLASERFGIYFLEKDEVANILFAVIDSKDIQSTNLICEKLMLVKSFIVKYPQVMIESLKRWLIVEVFPRIIIDDEVHSLKILVTATAVLLELLKKSINISHVNAQIYEYVEFGRIKEFIPEALASKIFKDVEIDSETTTFGDLLLQKIEYLILVKKEYKLAMDIWLSIMGLICHKPEHLLKKERQEKNRWLSMNRLCFDSNDDVAKRVSLKAWRVLTYQICTYTAQASSDFHPECLSLLKLPFEYSKDYHSNPSIRDGLLFHLFGIIYTTGFFLSNNESYFRLIWDGLISPIFFDYIFVSKSNQLKSRAVRCLCKLLEKSNQVQAVSGSRNSNSVKVISSAGIDLNEILALPPKIIESHFDIIKTLVFSAIKRNHSDVSVNADIYIYLLHHLPESSTDYANLKAFIEILLEIINGEGRSESKTDLLCKLSGALSHAFYKVLFCEDGGFEDYSADVLSTILSNDDARIRVLKEMISINKEIISSVCIVNKFLKTGHGCYKIYASNWISSTIFHSTVTEKEFHLLLEILKIVPTRPVIESVLHCSIIRGFELKIRDFLDPSTSEDETIYHYAKVIFSKQYRKFENEMASFLQAALPSRESVFVDLFPLLVQHNFHNVVKSIIHENPSFFRHVFDECKSFISLILPKEDMRFILIHSVAESESVRLAVLRWCVDNKEFTMLFDGSAHWEKMLFTENPPNDVSQERIVLIANLLEQLYEQSLWKPLSTLVELCLDNEISHCVIDLFSRVGINELMHLEPSAIAFMANKCGCLNSSLIGLIKESYKQSPIYHNCQLTQHLLLFEKFQIFSLCKAELMAFFMQRSSNLVYEDLRVVDCTFKMFLDIVQAHSKKMLIDFLKSFLVLLPTAPTPYLLWLARSFIDQINRDYESFKPLLGFEKMWLLLQKLASDISGDKDNHLELSKFNAVTGNSNEQSKLLDNDIQIFSTLPSNPITKEMDEIRNPILDSPTSRTDLDVYQQSRYRTKVVHECEVKARSPLIQSLIGTGEDCLKEEDPTAFRHFDEIEDEEHCREKYKKNISLSQTKNMLAKESSSPDSLCKHVKSEKSLGEGDVNVVTQESERILSLVPSDDKDPNLLCSAKLKKNDNELGNAQSTTEDPDASVMGEIRFPIFKYSNIKNEMSVKSKKNRKLVISGNVEDLVDSFSHALSPDITDHELSVQPEDSEKNLARGDTNSSLRLHFPSKKVRRLIYRLRGFSAGDISSISMAEKRNMRVELLDFMMQLEHDSSS